MVEEKTDEEICKAVQKGDIEAFGILVERYERKMKIYFQKFLSQKEDVEDLVQNVFLKAFENIQSFDPKRKFKSWIYQIAHNELVNALKRKTRFSFLSLDTFLPYLSLKSEIEETIDRKKMKEELEKCLEKLDQKYREVIFLFYFENLSYSEISEILKIPVSTVGIRLKRAKEKIKKLFEKNHGKT
ncbi:RNA polymerase sigma factor [Candidatus Parcubacteria bacterium]|nr:RNA polymerase sigma factor [Candidatus Parcubacteria bacterium]